MIAPLRPAEPRATAAQQRLRSARRSVAQSLLPKAESRPKPPAVKAWHAGLLSGWMVVIALAYVARLLGWWG